MMPMWNSTRVFRVFWEWVGSAVLAALAAGTAGAQGIPQRLERLEQRVDQLEAAAQPSNLNVNCASGQTVGAALARANTRTGPVTIKVIGNCQEGGLVIARDDITLRGAMPGHGITGPGGRGSSILSLNGAQRIRLEDLTFTTLADRGGAIGASNGASFTASRLHMTHGDLATVLSLVGNSSGRIEDTVIDGCQVGAYVETSSLSVIGNASAGSRFENCTEAGILIVAGNVVLNGQIEVRNTSVQVFDGGTLSGMGSGTIIEGGLDTGILVVGGSSATLLGGTTIRDKGTGIEADGSSIVLGDGALVTGNHFGGIRAINGTRVQFQTGAIVEDNIGDGLRLTGGSSSSNRGAIIRNNTGNGVRIEDTSVMIGSGAGEITSNSGWGILCETTPPAVAQIHGGMGTVSGNTLGGVSCP